ncbi:hypothetical protein C4568_00525 [Candidatus Parcubacteria bacterium]|nr:MAG: hypothetical protein C4568_00525 [Candidatus Parcubacteria bacterium]
MQLPTEKHLEELAADQFNHGVLSKSLLENILLKMELPNSFGIYGHWGTGKSTFLTFIRKHIDSDTKLSRELAVVYFEAWKYEYSDQKDFLFALLNEIKTQCGINNEDWQQLLIDVAVIASGVLKSLQIANLQDTLKDFNTLEGQILEDHQRWTNKVAAVHGNFNDLIQKALKKKKASKLIIFVDDLDRCLPENAVKLLEGIKNFLMVPNTLFVLAIDRRIIAEMIEKKYDLHQGYGDEYLTKIIQYYYELPSVELKSTVESTLVIHGIRATDRQIAYITQFLSVEAREPRIVKHVLHQFGVAVTLSKQAKEMLSADAHGIQLQYLFVASFLLTRFPSVFSTLESAHLLRDLVRSARIAQSGQNKNGELDEVNQNLSGLNPNVRKKLDSIMMHVISQAGVNNGTKYLDSNLISSALRALQQQS